MANVRRGYEDPQQADIDDLQSIVDEAHKLLDGAGISSGMGEVCDDPACQTRLGHRLRTLISERDDLKQQLAGRMRAR